MHLLKLVLLFCLISSGAYSQENDISAEPYMESELQSEGPDARIEEVQMIEEEEFDPSEGQDPEQYEDFYLEEEGSDNSIEEVEALE